MTTKKKHRAMHPEDARQMLLDYRSDREQAEALVERLRGALPGIVQQAHAAGISKSEMARLTGLHRETIHRADEA